MSPCFSLHQAYIFSGSLDKKWKALPFYFYRIPYNRTVAASKRLFPTVNLATKTISSQAIAIKIAFWSTDTIVFLFYSCYCFLFLLKRINIIQVFKFTSERKQICLLYKLGEHSHLQVSIFICRNDSQKPTLNFSFLHFVLFYFCTPNLMLKYISYFPTISDKYFIDEVLITSIIHYYKFYENHKENLKVNFSDLTLLIESCSGWPWPRTC